MKVLVRTFDFWVYQNTTVEQVKSIFLFSVYLSYKRATKKKICKCNSF